MCAWVDGTSEELAAMRSFGITVREFNQSLAGIAQTMVDAKAYRTSYELAPVYAKPARKVDPEPEPAVEVTKDPVRSVLKVLPHLILAWILIWMERLLPEED